MLNAARRPHFIKVFNPCTSSEQEGEMLNAARRPHFIKVFNPCTSSEQVKIPSKFSKHMEGKTSGPVSLVGPSGNTWHADLIQQNDCLFIFGGWETFVRDHFLDNGDSLVFRYDGNLHFTIQVFDQSSCEKETAFSAECHQDLSNFDKHFGRKREREYPSLLDNIVEGVPKKMRSAQVHSEGVTRYQETSNIAQKQGSVSEDVDSMCQAVGFLNESEYCGSPINNSVTFAVPLQSKLHIDDSDEISASEADRIARSFISSFPHFTQVMKRFNISGSYTLNIPYQFAMAHLPKCKVKIVLHNLKGQSWTVNSIPTTRVQTSHTFCGGWLAFVRGNNINVGDVCIFELVRNYELRVQILKVRNEGLDCESGNYKALTNGSSQKNSGWLQKKLKGNSRKTKRMSKIESQKIAFSLEKVKLGLTSKGSSLCSQLRSSNRKMVIRKSQRSQDTNGSHTKGCMSLKSAPEEKLAAESFISSFPHFIKIMKKFNISGSYTLKIPYQFSMEHLPDCRTEIILRNLKGESWTVNSIPTMRVQTLHTFCGGWMAFVRDNDIQMGDICIFELVGNCEMRVHISSSGRNGQDCLTGEAASSDLAIGSLISNRPLF